MTRALVAAAALALATAPAIARAGAPDAIPRDTDDTGYTLRPGEARLGLWKAQYAVPAGGPVPAVEIGTFAWPWMLWAASVRLVNAHAKATLYDDGARAVAARVGLFFLDLAYTDAEARFAIVPISLLGSQRLRDDLTLSGGVVLANAAIRGAYDEEDVALLQGAVAARSLQLVSSVEWRVARRTALSFRTRLVGFSNMSAAFDGAYQVDDYTRVEAAASGSADVERGLGLSAGVLAHWAWRRFNLKAGLQYGNYAVPGVHFVIPSRVLVPELDLYWRF